MLTPNELKQLRRLRDKAGGEEALLQELHRATQLPKRNRGRPAEDNYEFLMFCELMCRIFGRWGYGVKRNTILKGIIYQNRRGKTAGAEAAVRRIASKLRDPKFQANFTDENVAKFVSAIGDKHLRGFKVIYDRQMPSTHRRKYWTDAFRRTIRNNRG
jgi:hypothetical protein